MEALSILKLRQPFFLFLAFLLLIIRPVYAESNSDVSQQLATESSAKGKVLAVLARTTVPDPISKKRVNSLTLKVRINTGDFQGTEVVIIHNETDNPVFNIAVKAGDQVTLGIVDNGAKTPDVYITGLVRENFLYGLALVFVVLLLAIGWKKGFKSLCALLLTLVLIWGVLLPGILNGYSPLLLTLLVSIAASVLTLLTVGGFTVKSWAAILGTMSGVAIAGTIALIAGQLAHLTGFGSEEAAMLLYLPANFHLDIQGILISGIIIGALGASMDVSISIASAVEEVQRTNPGLTTQKLIQSGMNVGRDIMGTMANTLILAYTGGSMQLILVFMAFKESFTKIINLDLVASEIVRALCGSIGMIAIIPLTAVIAGWLFGRQKPPALTEEETIDRDFWQTWNRNR